MKTLWSHPRIASNNSMFPAVYNQLKIAAGREVMSLTDYSRKIPLRKRAIAFPAEAEFLSKYTPRTTTQTFADVMDKAIERVLQSWVGSRRRLAVWWSGGVDSTALMVGLMRSPHWTALLPYLTVRGTAASVAEHPQFFADYIQDKLTWKLSTFSDYFDEDHINVDGCFGDELFGTSVPEYLFERGITAEDTSEWPIHRVPEVVAAVIGQRSAAEWYYEQTAAMREQYRPINVWQFFWLTEFLLGHQDIMLRPYYRTNRVNELTPEQRRITFDAHQGMSVFGGVDFMEYALDYVTFGGWRVPDRDDAKRYILEYTGDQHYYDTKGKVYSQGRIFENASVSVVYEDWRIDANYVGRL